MPVVTDILVEGATLADYRERASRFDEALRQWVVPVYFESVEDEFANESHLSRNGFEKWRPLKIPRSSPPILHSSRNLLLGEMTGKASVEYVGNEARIRPTRTPYARFHFYGAPKSNLPARSFGSFDNAGRRDLLAEGFVRLIETGNPRRA